MEPQAQPGGAIRVFGGMGVDVDGVPISIGGPRQRRLLALLAVRSGSGVSNDWLVEHLWSDGGRPEHPATALRTYVSRLRTTLPEALQVWVETAHGGYRLNAPADAVEHRQFSLLRAQATRARDLHDPLAALVALDTALALWRGAPFQELEDLDWARSEIEQLDLDRLEMLEERWEAALALGRHTQITGELAVFTAEHRLRDRATRQFALALHRSGRTVEALRVVADHRKMLVDVSGLDPSPAIVDLETQLLSGDPSLDVDNVGRPLRGYRLIEEIGSGAFSVVWRGEQPSVEREVAIKQIRMELASQPEFIRRFEAEARMIARIEHPHIVPLIDFWRDPDSAYLVMRWLRGGTLERRLDDGPLPLDQVRTLARQVGDALSAAHAEGVVHRDVKSSNILFDEHGNAFLADFGIALEAAVSGGPEAALSQGTPAYASPEQIRREQLGPEADVFSLGVVLFECLTGSLPFASNASVRELVEHQLNDPFPLLSELRADLPDTIVDAIAQSMAKEPGDRFASVEEFLRAFESSTVVVFDAQPGDEADESVDTPPAGRIDPDVANPYQGLRAFDDGDADRFFGRESLVNELVRRLGGHSVRSRCVVVVGASGSGKSSVVRAGLLPALRDGAVAGSSDWFSTTMVPGSDPFESLEAALLRVAVNPPPSLLLQLREGRRGILRSVRRCLASDDQRVVLVVDQFEEIFTGRSAQDAHDFLDALSVAVEDPMAPLRLVVTLRADYYHRPLEHPSFARVLTETVVNVTPLAPDELERAIVEPARGVGVRFEPGLVARIAAETIGQPSPLPLLQYTLSELFDRRDDGVLTLAAYNTIGGFTGALASRAEALYAEADDGQRRAIRHVFGSLTNLGEESADLRRRADVADFSDDPAQAWVIEQFGLARLLTFDRAVATREPTVEVAHEALLREWPRLVEWLREDAELLRSLDAISVAANTWEQGGRVPTDLYRGGRLDSAVDVALTAPNRVRRLDTDFIDASRQAAEFERNKEQQRVRRLRRLVAVTATGLVIALVAGGLGFSAQRRAETAAAQAEVATIVSRSAALSADEPGLGILLALEAHRRQPGAETEQAVLNALASTPAANRVASYFSTFDDSCYAVPAQGALTDYGVVNGQLATRDNLTGSVTEHGPSPFACSLWASDDAFARRFVIDEGGTHGWLGPFDGPDEIEVVFDAPILGFTDLRTTDRVLLLGTEARTASVMDTTTGEILSERTIIDSGRVIGFAESSDVGRGAAGSVVDAHVALSYEVREGTVVTGETVVLDVDTGDLVMQLSTSTPYTQLAFDDATGRLVAAQDDGTIVTIDVRSGKILSTVQATASALLDLAVLADGRVVAVSASRAEFVDRQTGPIGQPVQLGNVLAAEVRADGLLQTTDADLRVEVLDLLGDALVTQVYDVGSSTVSINDGIAALVDPLTRQAEFITLSTGKRWAVELTTPEGEGFPVSAVIPDSTGIWAVNRNRTAVTRWVGGQLVDRVDLDGRPDAFAASLDGYARFSTQDDGRHVVQGVGFSPSGIGSILDVEVPNAIAMHVASGGGLQVVDENGTLRIYDSEGSLLGEIETGLASASVIVADPASGRIAIGGVGVSVVDPANGRIEQLRQVEGVSGLAFVQGGQLLAIGGADGTVRLWDVERGGSTGLAWIGSGQRVGIPPQAGRVADPLWITSEGRLLEISLDPDDWIERACRSVSNDLTQEEWDLFIPGSGAVQPACG